MIFNKKISSTDYKVLAIKLERDINKCDINSGWFRATIKEYLNKRRLTPDNAMTLMKRLITGEYQIFGVPAPTEEAVVKMALEELTK